MKWQLLLAWLAWLLARLLLVAGLNLKQIRFFERIARRRWRWSGQFGMCHQGRLSPSNDWTVVVIVVVAVGRLSESDGRFAHHPLDAIGWPRFRMVMGGGGGGGSTPRSLDRRGDGRQPALVVWSARQLGR